MEWLASYFACTDKGIRNVVRDGIIAVLDVGTTKVCCFIAALDDSGQARVIGIGHHVSDGLKAGSIVDMEAAETSIRAAVHAAEKMAGTTIREVVASIGGGRPSSDVVVRNLLIGNGAVGDTDMRRLSNDIRTLQHEPHRLLVHAIPTGYAIDGSNGIRDPRGLHGTTLGVNVHLVTIDESTARNLETGIRRCHLDLSEFVLSPYASGLACLVEDEMDLGVTIIDMGGGTTTIAVFYDGTAVFTDAVSVGGINVTNDIARGLSTSVADAERLKTLHGNALPSHADERESVNAPQVGDDTDSHAGRVPKSLLVGIIAPRIEEILELVRARLTSSGFEKIAGRRVVLTGGGSQLPGMRELASQILDKQVRLGKPIRANGLAGATGGPAFSTAAGLLTYAADNRNESPAILARQNALSGGVVGRLGGWFRENF
jgi:cell division protein FtsA